MKKKVCLLAALITLVVMGFAMNVEAAEIIDQGYCGGEGDGTNLTWTLDSDGVLVIEGRGEMREWPPLGVPGCSSGYDSISEWHKYSKDIKKVIVGFGVTTISNFAFTYHENMESIILPNTIEALYNDTFLGCDKLESLTLPDSLRYIGSSALFLGLKDIYYEGTREQWDAITNGPENYSPFLLPDYVTIHFNSRMPSSDEPSLDDCLINATSYNKDLAVYAANLSLKVYDDGGASDQSVRNYLMYDHGFSEGISKFYSNNYGAKFIFNWGSLAFTLATRKYNGPDADDNTYILVIAAQGSTNPYELVADALSLPDLLDVFTTQKFGGYAPYGIVEDFYNAIVEGLPNVVESDKKYKVLVTGHSLGGAAANLVAANLSDGRVEGVRTSRADVFCYTFGAINSIWPNSLVQNNYENIHNVYNLYDTFSPLQYGYIMDNGAGGGFGKFGCMHMFVLDYRTSSQRNPGFLESDVAFDIRQIKEHANHDMDKYLKYVELVKEGSSGFITRDSIQYLTLLFCPVDVDVYRGNELVGRVTNNVVDTAVTSIDIRVEGEAKIIIYPDEQQYELRISAFDEGSMTYGQLDLSESGGVKVIKDIALTQEKTFSSTVGENVDVEDVKLFVTDTSGEKIYEVLDDGTEVEVEAEPDTNDKLEDFVVRLYRNFLKREPDENGLSDWVDALRSGKGTGAKVVSGFVLSPEYKANSLSNEEYVTALYRIIFGREPDEAGLNSWVAVMENGCTNKKVLSGFINSNEFDDLCRDLGIARGSYYSDEVADQNVKVAAFVARLYKICLGRAYEQEGLNNWVSALVSKTSTGSSVVRGFFKSQEFENRKLDDNAFVTVAYRTILGREPDAASLNDWTKALDKGHAREAIIRGFLNSEEFGNLCEEYGITR